MSFGFSPGDIFTVVKLAWDTYQGAKAACGDHDRLTQEVAGLHKVLQRVHNEVQKSRPKGSEGRGKELQEHITASESILRTMDQVLRKYNALGDDRKKGKRLWQKIEFGSGKVQDLATIRAQLTSHTAAISMLLKLYMLGSLGRVETKLNDQGGELKGIRESIDWIAAKMTSDRSREGEGSVWTAYENDDKTFWRDLRRELLRSGYDAQAIAKKKSLIKGYVTELGERGVFDEDENENEDTESDRKSETDTLKTASEENSGHESFETAKYILEKEVGGKRACNNAGFPDKVEESENLGDRVEDEPKAAQNQGYQGPDGDSENTVEGQEFEEEASREEDNEIEETEEEKEESEEETLDISNGLPQMKELNPEKERESPSQDPNQEFLSTLDRGRTRKDSKTHIPEDVQVIDEDLMTRGPKRATTVPPKKMKTITSDHNTVTTDRLKNTKDLESEKLNKKKSDRVKRIEELEKEKKGLKAEMESLESWEPSSVFRSTVLPVFAFSAASNKRKINSLEMQIKKLDKTIRRLKLETSRGESADVALTKKSQRPQEEDGEEKDNGPEKKVAEPVFTTIKYSAAYTPDQIVFRRYRVEDARSASSGPTFRTRREAGYFGEEPR